jgi:hypothetical protein
MKKDKWRDQGHTPNIHCSSGNRENSSEEDKNGGREAHVQKAVAGDSGVVYPQNALGHLGQVL